jgi:hypothetical protein
LEQQLISEVRHCSAVKVTATLLLIKKTATLFLNFQQSAAQ